LFAGNFSISTALKVSFGQDVLKQSGNIFIVDFFLFWHFGINITHHQYVGVFSLKIYNNAFATRKLQMIQGQQK